MLPQVLYLCRGLLPVWTLTSGGFKEREWKQSERLVLGSNGCDLMPQCLLKVLNGGAMNPDERVSIFYRQVGANVELI